MSMPDSIEVQGGPISLVFSKTGRAFFSERITGNIWEVIGKEDYRIVKHLPVVQATGHHEAGVFGIALDPDFENNGDIYAYFTAGEDIDHSDNRVIRFSIKNNKEKIIISDIPAGRIHNGGVMAFGPDGKLYIGTGVNNHEKEKSQDVKYLGGKVLRINSDGSIPKDNPFKGSPVYSLGHRNVFGMAFNPKNGKLYVSDVGPDNDDEINIIKAGGNYGWPEVMGYSNNPRFIDPILTYTPVITPTQIAFYKDDLYFGSFNEGTIHKLGLSDDGEKVVSDTIAYRGRPFGLVGVFINRDGDFFTATTGAISKIKLINNKEVKMKKNITVWIIAAAVIILLAVIGIVAYNSNQGSNNKPSLQSAVAGTVLIQNFSFSPTTITINKGDEVTWQNNDQSIHKIVADDNSFSLGDMSNGGTSKHIFSVAGTYNYHCSIHPEMKGVVIVK